MTAALSRFVAATSNTVVRVDHIAATVPIRLLVAVSLASFAGVTALAELGGVGAWEVAVTAWFFRLPDAAGVVLVPAMELGNRFVAVVAATVVTVRWRWRSGAAVLAGSLGAWALTTVTKALVERPRIAEAALGGVPRDVVGGVPRDVVGGFSYPSSHTAVAFGLSVAISASTHPPGWMGAAFVSAAALTGVARMWLGVHLPLDVLGGALAGTACALVAVHLAARTLPGPVRRCSNGQGTWPTI